MEFGFPDKEVEHPKVHNGASPSAILWHEEVWGVKSPLPVVKWDRVYGTLEEKSIGFLFEDALEGWVSKGKAGAGNEAEMTEILWSIHDG